MSITGYTPIVIEEGLYTNRIHLDSFKNGDKFVLAWRTKDDKSLFSSISEINIASWEHNNDISCYTRSGSSYITIDSNTDTSTTTREINNVKYNYEYVICTVANSSFTESSLKTSKIKTFFSLKSGGSALEIIDFQIFKYIAGNDGVPIFPWG
jgi:hypothetical protein